MPQPNAIDISIHDCTLRLIKAGVEVSSYPIQTSAKGIGNRVNSFQTPVGSHEIAQKIGQGNHPMTVYCGRKEQVKLFSIKRFFEEPNNDWILSRILWLRGLEPGVNQGGEVDTYNRYIYIHGSPKESFDNDLGSHGCIRMLPEDIVDLFEQVDEGFHVSIRSS